MTNRLLGFVLLIFGVVSVQSAGVRTNDVALHLIASKSTDLHTLQADKPLIIWCAFDNPKMLIRSATFTRKATKEVLQADLSADKKNATLNISPPSIKNAGEYECALADDKNVVLRNTVRVYHRPIAHSSDDHFDVVDEASHHIGSEIRVELGDTVNLTCPVRGYPEVRTAWARNGKPLTTSDRVQIVGSSIHIKNVTYEDGAKYTCSAMNSFTVNQRANSGLLTLDRHLVIKSPYEFLYPLAVILLILILLTLIIVTCEWRKKKADEALLK